MFKFFRKKTEEISRTEPGFEETERKTPKAGILLLIIMFVAGIFFGWRALDDLGRIPNMPPRLSYCGSQYHTAYVSYGRVEPSRSSPLYKEYDYRSYGDTRRGYSQCSFSEIERRHGIPELFLKKQPLEIQRDNLEKSFQSLSASLHNTSLQIERLLKQYGVGIQEIQARIEDPLFATAQIREQLQSLLGQEASLKSQIANLERQRKTLDAQIKVINEELGVAYKPVLKEYNRSLRWYEFQVFLLQAVFTFPFFWFVFRWYRRLHGKNSPYTIISVAILAVAAILVLRVILFWFWDLFLAEIIRTLWEWIQAVQILRSILFYVGMVLSFAIFGGAVYWLQKRIFDPRRVTLRRFRAKQCPHCQSSLDLAGLYCPNCGRQLKEKCSNCGAERFIGLPACPNCGARK